MSTLKTTNLQHPSAGVPAIVLDADGDATYAGVHDFSAATVTGAPQGLVHIATETFSAVSSVSIDNCFTSTYENYLCVIGGSAGSTDAEIRMKLRASSTDLSTGYYWAQTYMNFGSASGGFLNGSNNSSMFPSYSTANGANGTVTINSPQLSLPTIFNWQGNNAGTGGNFRSGGGFVNNSNSYDGLTISVSTGTFTGTIRIYGYRNEA